MFELSTACMHTCSESLSPFIDSRVNDVLLHTIPDSNEALLQLIDVVHTTFVYTRCCITPQIL